jgi:hypothetical protein
MANQKNPTALLMRRMKEAQKGVGVFAALMVKFFSDNFGKTTLPKRVADFAIYDQLAAVGNTVITFFAGTYTAARSNFPGGSFTLPDSEHALITGIRIYQGAAATITATVWTPGLSTDAAAVNGLLSIRINGETVITNLPLALFQPGQVANGGTNEDVGYYYFVEPLVLLGQNQIEVQVTFPAAPATANYNLRFEIHGVRFIGG